MLGENQKENECEHRHPYTCMCVSPRDIYTHYLTQFSQGPWEVATTVSTVFT